ncbi:MAG: SAVED domain-containing protein [Thiotrichaceae bacterium]|nr:SAVED domain-containing protein [Thiotrichaceae bacterium]PCI13440.1 MAG: hypothetical protein COB71_05590 [Thiotrichales bacterium]
MIPTEDVSIKTELPHEQFTNESRLLSDLTVHVDGLQTKFDQIQLKLSEPASFMTDYLDPLGVVIGLLVAIPVFWSWLILMGNRRRQKQLIKSIQNSQGERPMALVVNVGQGDASNQVRAYLASSGGEMELEALHIAALNIDEIADFVQKLRSKRAEFMSKGVGKIHLFYFGPVTGALLVGDVFSNGSVTIYYYQRDTGGYEPWGPLTHPMCL